MIYVGGVPVSTNSSSSQAIDTLKALMEHPLLVSSASSFKTMPERKFSVPGESGPEKMTQIKCVYVFQREYATVDPAFVDLVGTDEATTCVGLVIRNLKSGMTSVAHLDSPNVVDIGLTQMLSLVVDDESDSILDVHLIGAFEDASPQYINHGIESESHTKFDGYSFPLCTKIVEALGKSKEKFNVRTFHVLGHNTRWDSEGNAYPIFTGFLMETSSGAVFPACFDTTTRCPDEIVRRIRLTASSEDKSVTGRLLETYDTRMDRFVIAPCTWTIRQLNIALTLQNLSDPEILLMCSTSPSAEGQDFVHNERRKWEYLIQNPHWRETFPLKQPRVFRRTNVLGSPKGHQWPLIVR